MERMAANGHVRKTVWHPEERVDWERCVDCKLDLRRYLSRLEMSGYGLNSLG